MTILRPIFNQLLLFLEETGKLTSFALDFFKQVFAPPYEFRELIHQCYYVGYRSLPLVGVTGLIMGIVLTLQTRPTLVEFGAESWMPAMVGISIIREISPVITALICAGRIGSGIGAELSSMRVTEQIDAMEVSGTNPFKFLVVTRIVATTLMLPILVILADTISLFGSYLIENMKGDVSLYLYFHQVFANLGWGDIVPATIKTFFFGFAIGLVGCFKGYYSKKGTAGVGVAANSAVVLSSMILFIIDFMAVLVADIFYDL